MWNCGYGNYLVLENSLFVAVTLVKNIYIDKYKYSGYGIRFDRHVPFLVPGGSDRNVIIFGVDMSSSVHIDNKGKDILFLGGGPTQGLNGTYIYCRRKLIDQFYRVW